CSIPSHAGYRNTIELLEGNNVVPLRFDTIRLVQKEYSFHGLRSEDPNQHLKDFLKLVDSLDLDVANKERTRLRLFQFSLRDQASNWLEPWTRFKDLLKKVPHHGIDLWLQVQIFYDRVNPATRRTIDQSVGGKLRDINTKESWELLEDLSLYDNESWNDPRDFAKPVKAISLPQDVPSTSGRRLIELKNQVQRLIEAHLAPKLLEETDHVFGLADGTKSYPIGIVRDVEVHIVRLKLLTEFYVIDMKKDPETPLLVGKGFLATANVVIDCREAKIVLGEGITSSDGMGARTPNYVRKDFLDCHFLEEWEIARDAEINPFKDILDKPPKNRDGAWHAKIRLIDPDGKEFTKTFQLVPTFRKLSEREDPREIINLDHFYDTLYLMRRSLEVLGSFIR
nr:MAK10-like protein [Tanacetum cinerariifolium]